VRYIKFSDRKSPVEEIKCLAMEVQKGDGLIKVVDLWGYVSLEYVV
jgi:hypothetical protein